MSMRELKQSKEKINDINSTIHVSSKQTFEQIYKRMTNYVEYDIYHQIMKLKETNEIRTIKDFINESLRKALKELQ